MTPTLLILLQDEKIYIYYIENGHCSLSRYKGNEYTTCSGKEASFWENFWKRIGDSNNITDWSNVKLCVIYTGCQLSLCSTIIQSLCECGITMLSIQECGMALPAILCKMNILAHTASKRIQWGEYVWDVTSTGAVAARNESGVHSFILSNEEIARIYCLPWPVFSKREQAPLVSSQEGKDSELARVVQTSRINDYSQE